RLVGVAAAVRDHRVHRRHRRHPVPAAVDLRAARGRNRLTRHATRPITDEKMSKSYDVVVIGAGPGGYIAAIRAAQLGLSTACMDEWKNAQGGPAPGGTCTNVGCIPSKALLQSSENYEHAARHVRDHGIEVGSLKLDLKKMLARKDAVVK